MITEDLLEQWWKEWTVLDIRAYDGPYTICKAYVGDETKYTGWHSGIRLVDATTRIGALRACYAHKLVTSGIDVT